MAKRPGLMARTAMGAVAGALEGAADAYAAKGVAARESMLRRLEAGEKFNFQMMKLAATDAALAKRDKTRRDFDADENRLNRQANSTEDQLNRAAKAVIPVGSPFAGEDGFLYQGNKGGKVTKVSADGKPVRAPKVDKAVFTQKDIASMILQEARSIRSAHPPVWVEYQICRPKKK